MSVRLSYADCDGNGTINPATEILEENNYYPFGLQHQGYNDIANSCRSEEAEAYQLNGKEYEDSFGLNIYEMDLRQLDPAIGRWVVQDPVVHHEYSPYSAFDNNPVFWSDPSGADADRYVDKNGRLVGAGFTGQDAIDAYLTLIGDSSKTFEVAVENTYEFETTPGDDGGGGGKDGGGNGNGGGKNKGANSLGIGFNPKQMGVMGLSGYTFFGAPVRLSVINFGSSSYVGWALNISMDTWKQYLRDGLDSPIGRHLMHEYGHYLQAQILFGEKDYISKVAIPSLKTINKTMHEHALNPVEMEASTLAYYYFGKPKGFAEDYNYLNPCISCNNRISHSFVQQLLINAYKYHPDYKEN